MYFTRQSLILPRVQALGPGMEGRVLNHPVLIVSLSIHPSVIIQTVDWKDWKNSISSSEIIFQNRFPPVIFSKFRFRFWEILSNISLWYYRDVQGAPLFILFWKNILMQSGWKLETYMQQILVKTFPILVDARTVSITNGISQRISILIYACQGNSDGHWRVLVRVFGVWLSGAIILQWPLSKSGTQLDRPTQALT